MKIYTYLCFKFSIVYFYFFKCYIFMSFLSIYIYWILNIIWLLLLTMLTVWICNMFCLCPYEVYFMILISWMFGFSLCSIIVCKCHIENLNVKVLLNYDVRLHSGQVEVLVNTTTLIKLYDNYISKFSLRIILYF